MGDFDHSSTPTTALLKTTYPSKGISTTTESNRLRRQHHFVKQAFAGRLVLPAYPLQNSNLRILDSGTADGYWLLDLLPSVGPGAELYGADIAAGQFPPFEALPSNVHLSVQNVTHRWPNSLQGTFDIVHQRAVLSCCRSEDARQLVVDGLFGLLKPGGLIQLVDANLEDIGQDPKDSNSPLTRFQSLATGFMKHHGMNTAPGKGIASLLKKSGCVGVQEVIVEVKLGKGAATPELVEEGIQEMLGIVRAYEQALNAYPASTVTMADGTILTTQIFKDLAPQVEEELRTRGGKQIWYAAWGFHPE